MIHPPPTPRPFVFGDLVYHAGREEWMTVECTTEYGMVRCWWWDTLHYHQVGEFPPGELRLVLASMVDDTLTFSPD